MPAGMDAATQALWNAWADARIMAAAEIIGDETGRLANAERHEAREYVDQSLEAAKALIRHELADALAQHVAPLIARIEQLEATAHPGGA